MKASYVPRRSRAYGNDLTWRMIYQRKTLGFKYKQTSENLVNLSKDSDVIQQYWHIS